MAKAGRTSKYALARIRRQLGTDGAVNVLGCILNDINLSRQREYGYYSYYYYSRYGYYTRDEKPAAARAHRPDRRPPPGSAGARPRRPAREPLR